MYNSLKGMNGKDPCLDSLRKLIACSLKTGCPLEDDSVLFASISSASKLDSELVAVLNDLI